MEQHRDEDKRLLPRHKASGTHEHAGPERFIARMPRQFLVAQEPLGIALLQSWAEHALVEMELAERTQDFVARSECLCADLGGFEHGPHHRGCVGDAQSLVPERVEVGVFGVQVGVMDCPVGAYRWSDFGFYLGAEAGGVEDVG